MWRVWAFMAVVGAMAGAVECLSSYRVHRSYLDPRDVLWAALRGGVVGSMSGLFSTEVIFQ